MFGRGLREKKTEVVIDDFRPVIYSNKSKTPSLKDLREKVSQDAATQDRYATAALYAAVFAATKVDELIAEADQPGIEAAKTPAEFLRNELSSEEKLRWDYRKDSLNKIPDLAKLHVKLELVSGEETAASEEPIHYGDIDLSSDPLDVHDPKQLQNLREALKLGTLARLYTETTTYMTIEACINSAKPVDDVLPPQLHAVPAQAA